MKIYVYLLEASLPSCTSQPSTVYAKLKIGRHHCRTSPVDSTFEPCWNQEFVFRLSDDEARNSFLQVSLFRQFEAAGKELLGRCSISMASFLDEKKGSLPPTWFPLQPKHHAAKLKSNDNGKVLLTMSLVGTNKYVQTGSPQFNVPSAVRPHVTDGKLSSSSINSIENSKNSVLNNSEPLSRDDTEEELIRSPSNHTDQNSNTTNLTFGKSMEIMESRDNSDEHENLQGGIVLDKTYAIDPKQLNEIIFEPNSQFAKDLLDIQGTTDYEEGPWTWSTVDPPSLTRTISYTKSGSKLVKFINGREEQTYLKANGEKYIVSIRVHTPEVPFGDCFQVILLYKILRGPELDSIESSSNLVISYNIDFSKSTLMKSMIESSVYQGLKDNFETFSDVLSRFAKPIDCDVLDKDKLLGQLRTIHQSEFEIATKYFCNFTVISTVIIGSYILVHIIISGSDMVKGLEFNGLDLPDSFGELITSGILFLLFERVINMVSRYVRARLQRGRDNEERENSDGWLLTIGLIEAVNLPSISSGSLDPYVILTCNGSRKTSSVQLQTQDPQWNEVIEFEVMEEPPSVLEIEVFNFDGPLDSAISLGHAEINFLKHNSEDLSDMWVPLEEGIKTGRESESRLHLRVFLENTRGGPERSIKNYLDKMEKQVGKKLNVQSADKNSTFQKIFGLPPEEYLIKDYSCSLKRKLPLQGRIFVSARVLGFYANLFGHKTKFFFMWEDVEDVRELAPSFLTVGTQALQILLKPGRGLDARHGAKSQDEHGRLKFVFHSFVSFNTTYRTIIALWRSKGREERSIMEEDMESDEKSDSDDLTQTKVKAYSTQIPVPVNSLVEIFDGGGLEMEIMGEVGCVDYSVTPWEAVEGKPCLLERQVSYKFNRYMSIFGSEVVSKQVKSPSSCDGWIIDDVMTLHNVPFGDHFRILLRYEMQCEKSDLVPPISRCDVFVGVEWLKKTKFKKTITANICDKLTHRSKEIFELTESKLAMSSKQDC